MGLCLEAARKPKFWSEYFGNNLNARPSTVNVIEAVRLCAFAPPSSPLVLRSVVVFPRSINNPALALTFVLPVGTRSWVRNYDGRRNPSQGFGQGTWRSCSNRP